MKKFLKIISLFLFAINCNSQEIISMSSNYNSSNLTTGKYLKDVDNLYSPFIGTWSWTSSSGSSSFTITLEKEEMYIKLPKLDFYIDRLVGRYAYINEGVTVVNTLSYPLSSEVPFEVWNIRLGDSYIDFSLKDIIKNKYCKGRLELIETTSGTATAVWKLFNYQKSLIRSNTSEEVPVIDATFSIPDNLVLTKL